MIPYLHFEYLAIGPIKVYTWGFFVSLGFLASYALLIRKNPKDKEAVTNLLLYILAGSIAGARIFYIAAYDRSADLFKIWDGGMSSFGGIMGGFIAILLYSFYAKIKVYELCQKLAFVLPLGLAIGRVGCFLLNEHPGIKTIAAPFSVAYPDGPRFDLGLFLMVFDTFLFIYFLLTSRKEKPLYLENFLLIFGAGRFGLDFLRIGEPKLAGLMPSQYVSILLMAIGAYLLVTRKKQLR